ncbi:MAG: GNAT family N-acetyltransferase [Deltaproteobacteria bacterium]|nr:GNAT family N-acetyltransferase [Deltaproteobacteria bacterium]
MFEDYPRETVLKDGSFVLLRPAVPDDEKGLSELFARIPDDESWFLRDDLADPEIMRQWIKDLNYDRVIPMVAVRQDDDRIIANVRLHRRSARCMRHVAHLRITVDPEFRQQRLGTWMLVDAIKLAMEIGIEKLVAEFVEGVEEAAISAAHKLDFFEQAVIKEYVMGPQGDYKNLIIMVKNIHRDWSDF